MSRVATGARPAVRRRPPTWRSAGTAIRGSDVAVAAVLGVIVMVVAGTYRATLVPTDPWHYVQGALSWPEPVWRPAGLSRWGFLLPMIPFARLWGDAEATYLALPLLSSGLLAGVLYLLGTRFVARIAGLLGALLALGTPLVFVNLTRGYPDLTATMLVGAAILLATLAEDAARGRDRWGWRVPALLLAAGFVTGWSFEVRETAVFGWPVVAWALWRIGQPLRTLAWFVPPALAWLAMDLALSSIIYGDPLVKFHNLSTADIASSDVVSDSVYVGHSRWWYLTILPRSVWALSGGPAIVACLVVGLVGGYICRAQLGRIWAWGALSLGLLWVQGGLLDPVHPSVRLDVARYWMSFIVPLMLAAAGAGVIALRRARGRWRIAAAAGIVAMVLGVGVPAVRFLASYPGFPPNGGSALAELREELDASPLEPDARIWADWGTQRLLPTYQNDTFGQPRWSVERFRSFNKLLKEPPTSPSGYPQPGDYVVLYSATDRTCWHCRRALGDVLEWFGPFPAQGWERMFTSSRGDLVLYRLGPDVQWPQLPEGFTPQGGAQDDEGGAEDQGAGEDGAGDGGAGEDGADDEGAAGEAPQ